MSTEWHHLLHSKTTGRGDVISMKISSSAKIPFIFVVTWLSKPHPCTVPRKSLPVTIVENADSEPSTAWGEGWESTCKTGSQEV